MRADRRVGGERPVGRGDEVLVRGLEDSRVESGAGKEKAGDELITLLSNNDSLEEQRLTNIYQTVTHHDWRYRIEDFCNKMNLPKPQTLFSDLARLEELASSLKQPM